jgi:hypothetical protein
MADNTARNFAQRATASTADTFEKSKTTAQEATKLVEHSYVAASKGAVDFNLKLIDIAQENVNAAFDFARELQHAPSPSAFFELSAAYTRKQCEKLAEQTQHLTGLAQKGMIDAVQSLQTGVSKTLSQPLDT